MATSNQLRESTADLVREIYRSAEQEGWSKEKLFKTLADPQSLKKSHRYQFNKRLQTFASTVSRPSEVPQVVQRMLADQLEREERKKKVESDQQQAGVESPFKKAMSPRKFEDFWEDQVELE